MAIVLQELSNRGMIVLQYAQDGKSSLVGNVAGGSIPRVFFLCAIASDLAKQSWCFEYIDSIAGCSQNEPAILWGLNRAFLVFKVANFFEEVPEWM